MNWILTVIKNAKYRRIVASAIDLYHQAMKYRVRAEAFAKDPDRAFKMVVRTAAELAGYKISEREVDFLHLEVSRAVMGDATDELKRRLKELDAMFARHGI